MNSQVEFSRSLNSDAMIGCVAITNELSALDANTPKKYVSVLTYLSRLGSAP